MSKEAVFHNIKYDTYARISRSKVHGVGVVAIKDIPQGINPFKSLKTPARPLPLSNQMVESLDKPLKKMVHDFTMQNNGNWYVPHTGFNAMDISFFMNHNDKPNMVPDETTTEGFITFKSGKNIKKGTELTIDYGS